MLDSIPLEILHEILESMPDLISLHNFLLAYPQSSNLYIGRFKGIFTSVLDRIESDQLRKLVKTVLAVRHNNTAQYPDEARNANVDFFVDGSDFEDPLSLEDIENPLLALCDIAETCQDLQYFEESFMKSHLLRRGLGETEDATPSPAEHHRIRRALWRIQLFCEIAYPKSSSDSDTLRRYTDITNVFMSLLTKWEFEEMKCLYQHICREYEVLKDKQAQVPVLLQKPMIRRLLTTFGFNLHERSPCKLEYSRDCDQMTHNLFSKALDERCGGQMSNVWE